MMALASMYAGGSGVAKDETKALGWIRRAAAAGHAGAVQFLKDRGEKGPEPQKPR
jgi:TPR repeat protein